MIWLALAGSVLAQEAASPAAKPAGLPAPLGVPQPGPTNAGPYAPQPILQGGIVVPLYAPDSKLLKRERASEAEQYNLSRSVPGRINSIVNIHNPSIEAHPVEGGLNTGAAVILAAGGGHNTLNVGTEGADFVPFLFNYGVNAIILRNRLRRDGYSPQADAVNDAQQAIRLVRAHAKEWNLDPNKIGIWAFPPAPSWPRPLPSFSRSSTGRTTSRETPWPGFRHGLISLGSCTPGRRPSRAGATRQCRGRPRRRSLFARGPGIAFTRSGPPSISPRCCKPGSRTSSCTSTATGGTRAIR